MQPEHLAGKMGISIELAGKALERLSDSMVDAESQLRKSIMRLVYHPTGKPSSLSREIGIDTGQMRPSMRSHDSEENDE